MSLDLGELRARVTVDRSRVPAELNAVQRMFRTFGGRLSSDADRAGDDAGSNVGRSLARGVGKTIGGVGKAVGVGALGLAGFGVAGAAALGVVGVAGAKAGLEVAAGNEQASISFTTMLKSGEKASKFLADLRKFAAETPFEFPELQEAASSLISAGIEADKVIPIMRTLGDVTSGMGTGSEGVERATIALQQMSAAGRITGEDLNQLRDAGIPVFDLLASATGKSKEEVVKLAQAGKLGKTELDAMMKALESGKGLERFSGLMEKQSQSLTGMWSTLKDTISEGLGGIMSHALPLAKDGLNAISTGAAKLFGYFADNDEAIGRVFRVAGTSAKTFGRITSAVLGAFFGSLDSGESAIEHFAGFLETHQEGITRGFVVAAKVALGLGDAIASGASVGLKALAWLADSQAGQTAMMVENLRLIVRAASHAFGWIPGVGEKLEAADRKFEQLGTSAVTGLRKVGSGARSAAGWIDKTMKPAIDTAQRKLDKVGETEIAKAKFRDSAARAGKAVRAIGTDADGSRVKLKKWNDISELATGEQNRLRDRLNAARKALRDQIEAARDAGAGQKKLTSTWKEGRDRLYDEFVQMGLSRKEARKLADQYAGVKPKVETKITQPGMKGAQTDTDKLRGKIDAIKGKTVGVKVGIKFDPDKLAKSMIKGDYFNNPGAFQAKAAGGPIQNLSGRGRPGVDTEPVLAAVDEHMLSNPDVRGVGGHQQVYRIREGMRSGELRNYRPGMLAGHGPVQGLAAGGPVKRAPVVVNTHADVPPAPFDQLMAKTASASGMAGQEYAERIGVKWATAAKKKYERALAKFEASLAGSSYSSSGAYGRWSAGQMKNAATIASVGSKMGRRAQLIGIATAIVESGLRNLGYGDRDSVGLFQQRNPWGSRAARMNPRTSAGMFFHGGRGGQRGLDDIPGWRNMSMGAAAQRVQVSAFPGRYAQQMDSARAILDALKSDGPGGGGAPSGKVGKIGGGRAGHQAAANRAAVRFGAARGTTYPGHSPTMAQGRDYASVGRTNTRLAEHFRDNHGAYGMMYVISQMRIASPKQGWRWRHYTPITNRGDFRHVRHVHASFYDKGTASAARGFGWTAEKAAELVVSPQLRHYTGRERVYNPRETKEILGGRRGPLVEHLHLEQRGNVRDDMAEVTYALRVIDSGGRVPAHA